MTPLADLSLKILPGKTSRSKMVIFNPFLYKDNLRKMQEKYKEARNSRPKQIDFFFLNRSREHKMHEPATLKKVVEKKIK